MIIKDTKFDSLIRLDVRVIPYLTIKYSLFYYFPGIGLIDGLTREFTSGLNSSAAYDDQLV